MVAQDRRGRRNLVPALLATFWILLALASSAYLYHLITDPNARRVQTASASQAPAPSVQGNTQAPAPALSSADAQALVDANAAKDREIAQLKTQLGGLTSQVGELSQRLRPLEKVLGPVASLPGSASVTTSEPGDASEPPSIVIPDAPLSAAAKARLEKPLPPGTSVPQTKPTDLSALTAKPAVPPKPAAKPAEVAAVPPPAPSAKPAVEQETQEPPAEVAATKPAPPIPPKPAAPQKQQTALAEPVVPAEPVKPAQKPAEPVKPADAEANSPAVPPAPAKPAPQVAAKPPASPPPPEPKADDDGSGPVQLSSTEPANSPPEATTDAPSLSAPAIPPGTTRFGIELGSVEKQDAVRPMWRDLLTNHAALVAGLQARRIIAPDKKWRLIAGPFSSAAEAMQACTLFKKADMPCEATVFAGDSL